MPSKVTMTLMVVPPDAKPGDDEPREVEVNAYRSATPGLFVHKHMGSTPYRWQVSHKSGWLVRRHCFRTLREGLACAEALSDVGLDWSLDLDALKGQVREEIRKRIDEEGSYLVSTALMDEVDAVFREHNAVMM